jgi:sec-independent protein translocase protein TatA
MSWVHWLIVIGVGAVLFGGGGKLSALMGDAAKGIRAFRDGLKGEDAPKSADTTTAPLPKSDKEG